MPKILPQIFFHKIMTQTHIKLSLQCLLVNHIFSSSIWCQDEEVILLTNTGTCHIQLAMGEAWHSQINTSNLEWLTLCLVDCHGKAQLHWKLHPLEWNSFLWWDNWYSWDEDIFSFGTTCENCGLDDMPQQLLHNQPGTIAQPWSVNMPDENDWWANLEYEVVHLQPWSMNRV